MKIAFFSMSLAGVLIGLGIFLIQKYGSAKYAEGQSFCEAAQLRLAQDAANNDRAAFSEIKTRQISDLDRAGLELGIMRRAEDR
jgi:hypothetical protein